MAGCVAVEELPFNYYAYPRYPFGARRVPVYYTSFHDYDYWSDDWGASSYDYPRYGGHAVPIFVVQSPFQRDADNFVKKRKLESLKGEQISRGGHNVIRNLPVDYGSERNESVFQTKFMRGPAISFSDHAATPAHLTQSSDANATVQGHHAIRNNLMENGSKRSEGVFPSQFMRGPAVNFSDHAVTPAHFTQSSDANAIIGGHNAIRIIPVEDGSKRSEGGFPSTSMAGPAVSFSDQATTPAHVTQSSQANVTNSRDPSVSNLVKDAAQPRVISIPIISADEGKDNIINCTVIPQEGTKKVRQAMSDAAAAILIQSWFRGYQVRKTAPLSQLRLIATVKSHLKDLDEKVSDADFMNDARQNFVAKMKLTEGIMNLLLRLDTIQGTHPDVRAIRKAVTKEVTGLQERVDLLLSAEMADKESSQLPMDVEEESRDETDRGNVTAMELRSNDSGTTTLTDADEEGSFVNNCAEPDPDQEENMVSSVEESQERMTFEVCRVENEESNRTQLQSPPVESETQNQEELLSTELPSNDSDAKMSVEGETQDLEKLSATELPSDDSDAKMSVEGETQDHEKIIATELPLDDSDAKMSVDIVEEEESSVTNHGEPDTEQDKGEVLTVEGSQQRMQSETNEEDELELIRSIGALSTQMVEAVLEDATDEYTLEPEKAVVALERNEPQHDSLSSSRREGDGERVEICLVTAERVPEEVAIAEVDAMKVDTNVEGPPQSGIVSENFPQDKLRSNEERPREELDDKKSGSGEYGARDGCNAKGEPEESLSPRCPFDAADYLNCQQSDAEFELEADCYKSKPDSGALLAKLSEENKVLKTLLLSVIKWNQLQGTAMQDVNHRLGKLESRISGKKTSIRRKVGKHSRNEF